MTPARPAPQAAGGDPSAPWFVTAKPVAEPRARLICLPYAGGTATVFHSWWKYLPADLEVVAVQLPGRGTRFREPPFRRMDKLVAALCEAMLPLLDRPTLLFGHSMGAAAAFDLLRALPADRRPLHFFPSGHGGPYLPRVQSAPPMHLMTDAELVESLRRAKGTPEQVLNDPSIMAMVLPTIRADFEALETWRYAPGAPLEMDVTAFGGDEDHMVATERLHAWSKQTSGRFDLRIFRGGHFFLHDPERLLAVIAEKYAAMRATGFSGA